MNQEQKREYERNWRKAHPEQVKAATQKWREENKSRVNATKRAWYAKNKDKINVSATERRKFPENQEKAKKYRENYIPSEAMKKRWTEKSRKHARRRKAKAVELLGGACTVCGLVDDPAVYDFHHRDPAEKAVSIAQAKSWAAIERELPKCDLVCANCHRKIHKV